MPNRREFLRNCAALAATAAFAPVATWVDAAPIAVVPLGSISLADFVQQTNTSFTLITPEGTMVDLELTRVQIAPPPGAAMADSPDAANEKFSLRFRGPLDHPLEQDTYLLAHPVVGCFSIFIVPVVVADASCRQYEAVFNRPARGRSAMSRQEKVIQYAPRALRKPRSF
jgi:hypothetical protein